MKYAARVLTAMVAAAAFPVFFLAPLLKLRYSVILAGENELALSLKEIFFSGDGQLPADKLFALDAMQPLKPAVHPACAGAGRCAHPRNLFPAKQPLCRHSRPLWHRCNFHAVCADPHA